MNSAEIELTIDLAMLDSDSIDIARLAGELDRLLEYVATMESADIDDVAVTTHGSGVHTSLRSDVEDRTVDADRVLECASDLEDRFIAIPNVL